MKKQISRISSKLTKTRVLAEKPELKRHIPDTRRMSRSVLHAMLQKYQMVYIKPCCGSLGEGLSGLNRGHLQAGAALAGEILS